mmetsp:Transcript_28637/g.84367  ORF Transcript_28637/g.84367 Transcript_28637/m.84367 type:complete len:201 (+) Transcript_28637:1807-2409(+)
MRRPPRTGQAILALELSGFLPPSALPASSLSASLFCWSGSRPSLVDRPMRMYFFVLVLGRSSSLTTIHLVGHLMGASLAPLSHCLMALMMSLTSPSVALSAVSTGTSPDRTRAHPTSSPYSLEGTAKQIGVCTQGCSKRGSSTSKGLTCSPPFLMSSFALPLRLRKPSLSRVPTSPVRKYRPPVVASPKMLLPISRVRSK